MFEKILRAFQPIIDIAQGIAYPLAFVSILTGICLVIVGQKRSGLNMVKWAAVGYIAAQWVPGFMKILAEVGKAMAN